MPISYPLAERTGTGLLPTPPCDDDNEPTLAVTEVPFSGTAPLTTQLFLPGEPFNDGDMLIKESLIMKVAKSGDGSLRARFDFVLA